MTGNGNGFPRRERRPVADAVAARRRAQMVGGLRGLASRPLGGTLPRNGTSPATSGNGNGANAQQEPDVEYCDLCSTSIPEDHRHMLNIEERRIVCTCESCWALRSGDAEYRPVGARTVWMPELNMPDDIWAGFQIPIGLAFFMYSTTSECVVAMYPSPAGATESELHFDTWNRLLELNPGLKLDPDIEGLIANRMVDPPLYAIAPIDRCYELTGAIKANWSGISGGTGVDEAVAHFFVDLWQRTL
jgi:hypothetical protein